MKSDIRKDIVKQIGNKVITNDKIKNELSSISIWDIYLIVKEVIRFIKKLRQN